MPGVKGMRRSKEHNIKISKSLKGYKKTPAHCENISKSAKKRYSIPENNSNWKGDDVGYQGIHIWLGKNFGYPKNCEQCNVKGVKSKRQWTINWCLVKGLKYERKRENFIALCDSCHRNYDKNEIWNKNLSISKLKFYKARKVPPC